MFTGIIEEVGSLLAVSRGGAGGRLRIAARQVCGDLRRGDSVSVNGVCLTAVEPAADSFAADISPETLRLSSLAALHPGSPVNLERALTPSSRLGGHIVQGHVDGLGRLRGLTRLGDGHWWLELEVPEELDRYFVHKGSVAIDGISLTIAEVRPGQLSAAVIPQTYAATNLGSLTPGSPVNLECDILAKYVEKLLAARQPGRPRLTVDELRELGF
jgi:riboflavin synthase